MNIKLVKAVFLLAFLPTGLLSDPADKSKIIITPGLLERARQGNAAAQLEAGFAFFRAKNPVRAAYWFYAAARQNLPEAQYNLGRCFMAGYGVKPNRQKAFEWFSRAAEQQLAPAMLECARFYLSGIEADPDTDPPQKAMTPDEKKAFELLEKLAKNHYIPAINVYARYLIKKYRNDRQQKIIALLDKAVSRGDAEAQVLLADYLLSRSDHHRDEKRARALLAAAAGKHPQARAKLALAVEFGIGAPPMPEKAFALYKQALEENFSPNAAARLANYYYSGSYGVKQDIPRAVELYTRAAAEGIPEAMTRLGDCCRAGIGVEKDPDKAFELYFQAAKMDYPPAAFALGRAFELGEGTPADEQAAFYWYYQSAMRYEPRGLLETGRRYMQGKGTGADGRKAVIFLEQAYANGMTEALPLLEEARKMPQSQPETTPQATPDFRL